jgi:membrane-associated phospholipid phosphatase
MRAQLFSRLTALLLLLGSLTPSYAQVSPTPTPAATDTTHKYENPGGVPAPVKAKWYRSKVFRATIVPAVLIGYGAYTFNGGFYTNEEAKRDVNKLFPNYRTKIDDILIVVPYLELVAVGLAGVESRDDRINTLLIIAKGEAIMLGSTFLVKHLSRKERPDGSNNLSFPSGHTAQAFLAASIVHAEFRDKSPWYGIGAYTLATSVAAFRMINNKHWQSDVFAGAGFGILSAHLAYLSHRNRWGRKPRGRDIGMAPAYLGNGTPGLTLSWHPKK